MPRFYGYLNLFDSFWFAWNKEASVHKYQAVMDPNYDSSPTSADGLLRIQALLLVGILKWELGMKYIVDCFQDDDFREIWFEKLPEYILEKKFEY